VDLTAPRRVVVTGCGVVTPAGSELDAFWSSLTGGVCTLKPLRDFSHPEFERLIGGEVFLAPADALPSDVDEDAPRARCIALALAAVGRGALDAQVPHDVAFRERTGLVMGISIGEERQVSDLTERWVKSGSDAIDAGFFTRADNQRLASVAAERHGFGGPVMLAAGACSAGSAAIATAFDLIRMGSADCVIAGGVDTLTRATFCGFSRMGALSASVCRPYDKNRDGVSFGEGAGVVVLEDFDAAKRRGARIYAEIAGYGVSNDAHHTTAPDPSGSGFARAIRQALETTGTLPGEVDYVSAHGTGTKYSDLCETRALHAVFGDRAASIPMSSIKSMIGHTNGAASAIETVACVLAIKNQTVPPTVNLLEPDPECMIDCVPNHARAMHVRTCLNLSAGFGGFNACLVIRAAS
jgi:3-oxoacyl-[acyl-carrier-protein] synthase II